MRTTTVEHETEDTAQTRGAESQRKDGAQPVAELANAPAGLLQPHILLRLQAMAGNAAVAGLIETRKPETATALEPPARGASTEAPPATSEAPPATSEAPGTTEAPPAEEATDTAPRAEDDDELAALDAAADAAPVAGQPNADEVAQNARAELADQVQSGDGPEASGGAGEPGVPIEARPPPVAHDVSTSEPAAGLAQVGRLPPAQLLSSLGSVSSAVDQHATGEHRRLAASAPRRARHPGAPSTVESPASSRIALPGSPMARSIPTMPEVREVGIRRPASPPAVPELPARDGKLPTRDPGLDLKPGPLPQLSLYGNADPASVQQQRSRLLSGLERERAGGQQEAGRPLGEDEIFPIAPAETLMASVGQAPGGAGQATAPPKPSEDDEAASIIAQDEKSGEIQGAVGTGLASLAGQRQEYAQRTEGERARADAEMAHLEQANAQEQAGERGAARRDVHGLRTQWTTAQQELVAGAQREADQKTSETLQTVAQERAAAEEQAAAHYQQGQQEAQIARRHAEQQAASERQKAQGQSQGGLLGAIGSAAQSLFDKAKQVVQSVFDRARQLVRAAIERAQQLATAVMERAQQTIVGAIRLAGNVLAAIGDRVLFAFPGLRDRFRRAVQERIAAAEAVVNKLAGTLKRAIQGALNILGFALSAAIGLMRKGMQAALDGVRGVVQGALDFARGALAALGTFAVLVKDIAANPVRWISNLAAAARDGIRNHLWPDLKAAVQGWFSEKVDAVLGLGPAVWNLLRRGGITVAQVGTFAWEGIKSMIPQTVIWVLIEKLVALIVPAAAAVMLIIQALQAAWGSLGRILQAVDAFVGFLKGVRWGNAGPLFGKAIAAGAVAVIEFISQFLLQRLMSAAGAVAGKLRSLAKRIGARLASGGRKLIRGLKSLPSGAARLVRGTSKAAKRGAKAVGDKWFILKNRGLAQKGMAWIDANGDRCVRHGPMNSGQLKGHFESSFRSSTYTTRKLGAPRDLYRAYSDPVRRLGAFWSDVKPTGPLQATIDSALLPSYGNTATKVVHIRVPAGEVVHEGVAARQQGWLGGGTQFVLPKVLKDWEMP